MIRVLATHPVVPHLLVDVGGIAPIVNDKDDQAVGPDDAQGEDQNEHRFNGLRDANVSNEVVARVAWMRAARVLHGGGYQE